MTAGPVAKVFSWTVIVEPSYIFESSIATSRVFGSFGVPTEKTRPGAWTIQFGSPPIEKSLTSPAGPS